MTGFDSYSPFGKDKKIILQIQYMQFNSFVINDKYRWTNCLHTSFVRAILKSLNRKVVSEKRLQTYFLKFARLITALCDDTDCLSALHTLNYTQIQFRFLLSRIHEPSVSLPPYIHRVVDMTLEFICLEKELLYHRIEHPRSFISEPALLHRSLVTLSAISVSEILCGLDRMTPPPFVLADGSTAPFNLVVRVFENTLHVKLGDPTDVKRRVLERKKDRTKFTDALLYSLNKEDE